MTARWRSRPPRPPRRRRRILLALGAAMTVAFIVLRAVNIYGDPQPWSVQTRGALYTVLSFLNTAKYPPSLLFLLMTRVLITYGRVPLFFYVLQ